MTPKEAQEILATSYLYEMPGLLNYALSFALFKTYAIVSFLNAKYWMCMADNSVWQPSVSHLLAKTRQLTTTDHVAKRYADVGPLHVFVVFRY
jgi:hypothetical protein